MENASKALIMVASLLISIMVLAFATFLFMTMGKFSKEKEDEMYLQQLAQFNAQFSKYEYANDVKAQDIASMANLAKNINNSYGAAEGEPFYICILFNGIHVEKQNDINNFIKTYAYDTNGELKNYRCTKVEMDSKTGKVNKVIFQN